MIFDAILFVIYGFYEIECATVAICFLSSYALRTHAHQMSNQQNEHKVFESDAIV